MNVIFRTDASTRIGTGHVMRCLTLATAIRERGGTVSFVCRRLSGHLCDFIAQRGWKVLMLPAVESDSGPADTRSDIASLAVCWSEDAVQTREVIESMDEFCDWLVVDHYALGGQWESAMRGSAKHIMVIDDLADRVHDCDVLLDQNFASARHRRYGELVPARARQLLGSRYALVRSEFLLQREASLARRDGHFQRLLVSMGGADPDNDTATALTGIAQLATRGIAVEVVLGQANPWQDEIRALCRDIPGSELHVQTEHMAQLMTRADLAISACGSTTWERCVVGLPAIVAIQSDDQAPIAQAIQDIGGHQVLGWSRTLTACEYWHAIDSITPDELIRMSTISARLCDGQGADRVASELLNFGV
jgi:UDP-2,4-diacetamido-2,4,6-trideoxy-beta-L-altropyranose hydrolase